MNNDLAHNPYVYPIMSNQREYTVVEKELLFLSSKHPEKVEIRCIIENIAITIIYKQGRMAFLNGYGPTPIMIENRVNVCPDTKEVREIFQKCLKKESELHKIVYNENHSGSDKLYSLWLGYRFELHFFPDEIAINKSILLEEKRYAKHTEVSNKLFPCSLI